MTKRGWSIDSLAIIFSIIVIAQLLTYAVPQGEFERQAYAGDVSRQMVVAGTFDYADVDEQVSLKPGGARHHIPDIHCWRCDRDTPEERLD